MSNEKLKNAKLTEDDMELAVGGVGFDISSEIDRCASEIKNSFEKNVVSEVTDFVKDNVNKIF